MLRRAVAYIRETRSLPTYFFLCPKAYLACCKERLNPSPLLDTVSTLMRLQSLTSSDDSNFLWGRAGASVQG